MKKTKGLGERIAKKTIKTASKAVAAAKVSLGVKPSVSPNEEYLYKEIRKISGVKYKRPITALDTQRAAREEKTARRLARKIAKNIEKRKKIKKGK